MCVCVCVCERERVCEPEREREREEGKRASEARKAGRREHIVSLKHSEIIRCIRTVRCKVRAGVIF